jgi:hypothetical protein
VLPSADTASLRRAGIQNLPVRHGKQEGKKALAWNRNQLNIVVLFARRSHGEEVACPARRQ